MRAKYQGKVLSVLRRDIGITTAAKLKYHVTVNSATERLESRVMSAALTHHLVYSQSSARLGL